MYSGTELIIFMQSMSQDVSKITYNIENEKIAKFASMGDHPSLLLKGFNCFNLASIKPQSSLNQVFQLFSN